MKDFWNRTGETGKFNVYFRKEEGGLGQMSVAQCKDVKDARMQVREALVADGEDIRKRAVLAVIPGRANGD